MITIELFKMWDVMVELNIATEEEIDLVCRINGWTKQSLEDILYVRTGLRSYEQLKDKIKND